MSTIKEAIRLADENKGCAYSVGFRLDLSDESCFYGHSMYTLVVFPKVLKLIDEHPDLSSTYDKPYFVNALDYVVFVYKWVIETCDLYYQIQLKDCEKFFEDFTLTCDGEYMITELRDFYYNSAKYIALKFDKRNGTDYYMNMLSKYYGE